MRCENKIKWPILPHLLLVYALPVSRAYQLLYTNLTRYKVVTMSQLMGGHTHLNNQKH